MKKILKWVFPVVLGIAPAIGGGDPDKEFLNHADGTYTITKVREMEVDGQLKMIAIIEATIPEWAGKIQRTLPVEQPFGGFTPTGWNHDDENLVSHRKGNVFFDLPDNKEVTKEYTKSEGVPYTVVSGKTVNLFQGNALDDRDLPLGAMVEVHAQTEYLRPNQTLYLTNELLGQAIAVALVNGEIVKEPDDLFQKLTSNTPVNVVKAKAEDIEKGAEFLLAYPVIYQVALMEDIVQRRSVRCYKEGDEISQWKKKWRHWWQYYIETETTPKLYKILQDSQKVLYRSGTLRTQTVFHHQDEGRTNHDRCPNPGETW